jgi:hypothetical protein
MSSYLCCFCKTRYQNHRQPLRFQFLKIVQQNLEKVDVKEIDTNSLERDPILHPQI